jgi:hypothetical protein
MAEDRRSLGWISLSAIALGVGALWLWDGRGGPTPEQRVAAAADPAHDGEVERLHTELMRMQSKLARAEKRIANLETAKVGQLSPGDVAAERGAGLEAEVGLTDADQRNATARAFEAETTDPAWDGEREIQRSLTTVLPAGSTLHGVGCRSTLCRVETHHPDEAGQQAFVQAIGMPMPGAPRPWKGALFAQAEPSGNGRELRSVTYLVRRGHAFPSGE